MKHIFCLLMALVLCSCSSTPTPVAQVACSAETALSGALAASVATTLQCSNLAAVQADLLAVLGKANFCAQLPAASAAKKSYKGAIGNLVCPIVVNSVLGVVNSKIPAAWGCVITQAPGTIGGLLTTACESNVSF